MSESHSKRMRGIKGEGGWEEGKGWSERGESKVSA